MPRLVALLLPIIYMVLAEGTAHEPQDEARRLSVESL